MVRHVRRLRDFPVLAQPGQSAIAPVEITGLPPRIAALGRRWQRKVEFHMTVIGTSRIEFLARADAGIPERVAGVVDGRAVGPVYVTRELRRVRHPEQAELETIVVMVECPALAGIYRELSEQVAAELAPPPAHVTLYSTDPEQGIGINDGTELRERAPQLSEAEQEEVRQAMRFDEVLRDTKQR
jgi:hypothetical protein